jgi:hypothetical protein
MFCEPGRTFYDSQLFGSSFIFEPLHYGFGNLFSTYENFDHREAFEGGLLL